MFQRVWARVSCVRAQPWRLHQRPGLRSPFLKGAQPSSLHYHPGSSDQSADTEQARSHQALDTMRLPLIPARGLEGQTSFRLFRYADLMICNRLAGPEQKTRNDEHY